MTDLDWGITIVPIIDPLDLTRAVLSGSSSPAPSPSPGQTVAKGIICHELKRVQVEYFILITNLLLSRLGFVGL
jgi:hypothetical protein